MSVIDIRIIPRQCQRYLRIYHTEPYDNNIMYDINYINH